MEEDQRVEERHFRIICHGCGRFFGCAGCTIRKSRESLSRDKDNRETFIRA